VWIIITWQCFSEEDIVKGFKKCCVYNAVDETDDDDMLWNGSEEDGNVRNECEEDEGTYWLDGDSDIDWLR